MSAINDKELEGHRENGQAVFDAINEIREVENGYTFRLPAETELIQKAGAFIARERLCCPFFEFSLNIGADGGPVWLRLTGREEVKPYIKENLLSQLEGSDNFKSDFVMNSINPDQKVAHIVEKHPQTWQVFQKYGCPDMRDGFFSLMARIMSIRNAARIHRIPLDELIEDLEKATSPDTQNQQGTRNN